MSLRNENIPATRAGQSTTATTNPDALEVAPGTIHDGVEGWIPDLATEDELRIALEKAFDYRGDVTIILKNNTKLEGYIFDRVTGPSLSTSFIRVLLRDSHQRVKAAYSEIAALAFTGRDTAAGKSWEAWTRKYWEKKAAGETDIALKPDQLE